MPNTYHKFAPNVWLAKCSEPHEKGDIIPIANKYGKESDHQVFNCVKALPETGIYYYSVVRCGESYAKRRAEKWEAAAEKSKSRSDEAYEAAQEGRDFLSLGEPIKIGHHSEKRHRALIEKNNNRMRKSCQEIEKAKQQESKAEYWKHKASEITIAMPESLEYFAYELEKAQVYHLGLKNKTIRAEHSNSLAYAKKRVNELEKLCEMALLLWG